MSRTIVVMFGYLIAGLLTGQVFADLQCKDYIPANWTTPRARINAISVTSPSEPFLPANMSATSPWTFASTKAAGVIFNIKTCNSTSLKIKSSISVSCNDDGTGCFRDYYDYVQIIHPSTGHCLTNQNYAANSSLAVFQPCDVAPKTPYQLWWTDRTVYLQENCCFSPGPPVDWNPYYTSIEPLLEGNTNSPSFKYAKDDKTVMLVRNTYPDFELFFKPVDPLTNKPH